LPCSLLSGEGGKCACAVSVPSAVVSILFALGCWGCGSSLLFLAMGADINGHSKVPLRSSPVPHAIAARLQPPVRLACCRPSPYSPTDKRPLTCARLGRTVSPTRHCRHAQPLSPPADRPRFSTGDYCFAHRHAHEQACVGRVFSEEGCECRGQRCGAQPISARGLTLQFPSETWPAHFAVRL
jgi:hypothetical protein